ncbi:MAG: hypothetical protein PVI21_06280 [Candidatus Woesebacteria bacterium]|jgi:hypothetical protein
MSTGDWLNGLEQILPWTCFLLGAIASIFLVAWLLMKFLGLRRLFG